jgi:hypothetical protein
MATVAELATFEHVNGLYACFLVPKSGKWLYGVLLHHINRLKVDNKGTFLMSDGTCKTYPLRLIREAITRLIKGDPQWSEFKRGFPSIRQGTTQAGGVTYPKARRGQRT